MSDPSESREADLLYRLRKNPNDLDLLKEMLRIREAEGNEADAAEYRRRICLIDPADPDIQGKEIAQRPLPEVPADPRPFREALRYPWQGRGRETVIAGSIFLLVGRLIGAVVWWFFPLPILGQIFSLFILSIPWGATLGLWFGIARASARGEGEVPEWPEFREFYPSMLIPCVATVFAGLTAFWPFMLFAFVGVLSWGFHPLVIITLVVTFLGGCFIAPMVLLAYASFETFESMTRVGFLTRSIIATLPAYTRIVLVMLIIYILCVALGALSLLLWIPIYYLVTTPVWFLAGILAFRLLGKFYIQNRRALNWFGEVVDTGSSPLRY